MKQQQTYKCYINPISVLTKDPRPTGICIEFESWNYGDCWTLKHLIIKEPTEYNILGGIWAFDHSVETKCHTIQPTQG